MSSILQYLPSAQQDFLGKAFDDMALALPENDEVYLTADVGYIAFINPAACVLRISRKDRIEIFKDGADQYDHILQPLMRREGEGLIVDLYPGVHTIRTSQKILSEKLRALKALVLKDGYVFADANQYNFGNLPGVQLEGWPEGFPVIIDPGAVELLNKEACAVREILYHSPATRMPVQDVCYADLRVACRRAMEGEFDQKRAFWQACRTAKEQGRLVAGWNVIAEQGRWTEELSVKGQAYEKRLSKSPAFAPLMK